MRSLYRINFAGLLKDLDPHSCWTIYYKFVSQSSWIVFQRWQESFDDQRFISAERFKCKLSTLALSNTVFPHTATYSWNQLSGYSKIAQATVKYLQVFWNIILLEPKGSISPWSWPEISLSWTPEDLGTETSSDENNQWYSVAEVLAEPWSEHEPALHDWFTNT